MTHPHADNSRGCPVVSERETLLQFRPQLDAATPEPSLRAIVYGYYREHFSVAQTEKLTEQYLDAILAALRPPALGEGVREALRQEIINSPETADFMAGVPLEAAHQRERWGVDHDGGKTPFDWFWLIGYLAQKAASSQSAGDTEKALHHTISTAAALANWHAAISGAHTAMRPGIAAPEGGA